MDELIEAATGLRKDLEYYIEPTGLSLEVFEDIGVKGIIEVHENGVAIDESIFANELFSKINFLPIQVVRAICLGAAHLMCGLGAYRKKEPYAINFLMIASHEIGFVRGMACGVMNQDSINARYAAFARHAADPKQADKSNVRECWELWKKEPYRYKSKASFARDMLQRYYSLESQRTIERWCKEWEEEANQKNTYSAG